jgi:hypothetical protein
MAVLYSEKRSEIKTGDLLAWKATKINSFFDLVLFLYQKIFKAKYTHVAIAFKEGNRLFILEATPPEVRLFPVSMTDDFYLFSLNLNIDSSHIDIILRKLGIKYGLCDLIRGILKLSDNKKEEYCSELASKFYNEIGFINDKEAGFTPDTIVEAIQREHDIEPILVKIDRNNLSGV